MRLVQFKLKSGVFLLLIFLSNPVFSQNENIASSKQLKWDIETQENYALLSDNREDNLQIALPALEWLLANQPTLTENIYIFGAQIYKGLIEKTSDQNLEKQYFHQLTNLYRNRTKYYGDAENNTIRFVRDVYLIGKKVEGLEKDQLIIFDNILVRYPKMLDCQLGLAYMDVVLRNYTFENISQDSLFHYYLKISDLISDKREENPGDTKCMKNQELIDKIFASKVKLNCEDIHKKFSEKLLDKSRSGYYSRLVVKLSIQAGCTKEAYFLPALEHLYNEKPSPKVAIYLSGKFEQMNKNELAEKYLIEAIQHSLTQQEKVELTLELAKFHSRMGEKKKARDSIREVLVLQPGNKKAFELLGDLYFGSYDECRKGKSRVEDRLIFILAYEQYKLAGNLEKMNDAGKQFPSGSDIHMENFQKGDELNCDCWVDEKVVLAGR